MNNRKLYAALFLSLIVTSMNFANSIHPAQGAALTLQGVRITVDDFKITDKFANGNYALKWKIQWVRIYGHMGGPYSSDIDYWEQTGYYSPEYEWGSSGTDFTGNSLGTYYGSYVYSARTYTHDVSRSGVELRICVIADKLGLFQGSQTVCHDWSSYSYGNWYGLNSSTTVNEYWFGDYGGEIKLELRIDSY